MAKIIIIYGSCSGNTRSAAQLIGNELGGEVIEISTAKTTDFDADLLILGTSTWGIGDLQDDWQESLSMLDQANLHGKKIALFGMGDQISFGDSFIDGVKIISDKVMALGATVIGKWSTDGYLHSHSAAEEDKYFLGLALDDDNQPNQTPERIGKWCRQLKHEAGI